MSAILTQIKVSYESNGMTPEQIAEDQGLDLLAVKSALMQCSSVYRKDCGSESATESNLNFSDDDMARVTKQLVEIALTAEDNQGNPDYRVRAQVCQYIRDDKKGRKDVVKTMRDTGGTVNIFQLNENFARMREIVSKQRERLIEV